MPIYDSILTHGDRYMIMADFDCYIEVQNKIEKIYKNEKERWTKSSIMNVAHMGKFSSDRAIKEYADEIWNVKPLNVKLDKQ
jgi:starch phosphorylase